MSPSYTVTTLNVPSQPSPPVVQANGLLAVFTWAAPSNNGATITQYNLKIITSTGSFLTYTGTCSNTNAQLTNGLECDIPFTTLTSSYGLLAGSPILVKVSAVNS